LNRIPPAALIVVLGVLLLSQLLYVLYPYRNRRYVATLVSTAVGVGLGQAWNALELPGVRFGDVNLLPALLFVLALQPLVSRLPQRREP
jgi:hypothetical protein